MQANKKRQKGPHRHVSAVPSLDDQPASNHQASGIRDSQPGKGSRADSEERREARRKQDIERRLNSALGSHTGGTGKPRAPPDFHIKSRTPRAAAQHADSPSVDKEHPLAGEVPGRNAGATVVTLPDPGTQPSESPAHSPFAGPSAECSSSEGRQPGTGLMDGPTEPLRAQQASIVPDSAAEESQEAAQGVGSIREPDHARSVSELPAPSSGISGEQRDRIVPSQRVILHPKEGDTGLLPRGNTVKDAGSQAPATHTDHELRTGNTASHPQGAEPLAGQPIHSLGQGTTDTDGAAPSSEETAVTKKTNKPSKAAPPHFDFGADFVPLF